MLILLVHKVIKARQKTFFQNLRTGNINNDFIKPNPFYLREIDPDRLMLYEEDIDFLMKIEKVILNSHFLTNRLPIENMKFLKHSMTTL